MSAERPSALRASNRSGGKSPLTKNQKRRMFFEALEERRVMAVITGGTGPGGIELVNGSSELEIWLDATDINANGTATGDTAPVTSWQDKSGNDRDFDDLIGDPNFVLSSTHGLPAVNFDGDDALRTGTAPDDNPRNFIDGNGAFTLISVARYSGGDRERVISAKTGHNWLFGFHGGSTNRNGHYDGWGSLDPAPVGFSNDANWHLHMNAMNVFNDANNPAGDWYRDGLLASNDDRGTGDSFANNVPDGLSLGAWNGLGESSTAEVSELLMYNRVLNDAELRIVANYLAGKYNVTPILDVYAGDQPGNGDFDRDIFGIGRFSAGSQVLSAGQSGFGIEAAGLADDGDYVLAGHKAAINGTTAITGLGGVESRWNRTWYVDVTDGNNNVGGTMAFDFSDAGLTLTNESRFSLLKSLDGGTTFSVVQQINTGSPQIVGDTITFNVSAAELETGVYTLGTASVFPLLTPTGIPLSYVIGDGAVPLDAGFVVNDLDSPNLQSTTVAIQGFVNGDADVLGFINQNGITGSYNNSNGTLTLIGTSSVANYQTAIRSITYSNTNPATPRRTVVFTVTDTEVNASQASRDVTVQPFGSSLRFIWDGNADGDGDGVTFTDPLNWDRNTAPGAADTAVFSNLDPGTVDLTAGTRTVGGVIFENNNGAFTLTNGALSVGAFSHIGTSRAEIAAQLISTGNNTFVMPSTLALTNLTNSITGIWTVSGGGRLDFAGQGSTTALGGVQLNATNLTLNALGQISTTNGLMMYSYTRDAGDANFDLNGNNGMLNGGSPTTRPSYIGQALLTGPLTFGDEASMIATGALGGVTDNYNSMWFGYLNSTEVGTWQFQRGFQDDWTGLWIDIDQDGIFESTTPGLGSDRGEQIAYNDGGVKNVNLTNPLGTGRYLVAFTHLEGGGGANVSFTQKSPSEGSLTPVNPTAQPGRWTTPAIDVIVANNINIGAGVTFNNASGKVTYSDVNAIPNLTINSTGAGENILNTPELQGQTTINSAAGNTATLQTVADVGGATGLTITGTGRVKLTTDNTYSGQTIVTPGARLITSASAALGSGDGTEARGTIVQSGGTLQVGSSHSTNELLVLNGTGVAGQGALSSGSDWNGGIRLDSATRIQSTGNLRMFRQINLNGNNVEFQANGQFEVWNGGITGGGNINKTGGGRFVMLGNADAGTNFTGSITINGGIWDARGNNSLGTAAGGVTVNSGYLEFRDATITNSENITINNRDGAGSIRLENNSATLNGNVTATVDTLIWVNPSSLTINGQILGGRRIDKGGSGLLWLKQESVVSQLDLQGGTVRISHQNGLGSTTSMSVDGGETLEFDGNFNFGASFSTPLTNLNVSNGTLSSFSGKTTLTTTINVGILADVNLAGAGDLDIQSGFGNGSTPLTSNFLNHFGFRRDFDPNIDLNNNGGAYNFGNPAGHPTYTGQALLTSQFLFPNEASLLATGVYNTSIGGYQDNYVNFWFGYLNTTEIGTLQLQRTLQDDWTGIWVDIDQDGTFESTTPGMGSDRGEQIAFNDGGVKNVPLNNPLGTGRYLVAFMQLEGGGEANVGYQYKLPSGSSLQYINPGDAGQSGLWSGLAPVVPTTNVNKSGTGTATLSGNNTFNGTVRVNAGTLVAAHNNALGAMGGGGVAMQPGATFGLSNNVVIMGENIVGGDGKAAGRPGTIVSLDGTNMFVGNITASNAPGAGQELSIIAAPFSQLTIGNNLSTLDARFSKLTIGGDGDLTINSAISSLNTATVASMARGYLFNGNVTSLPGAGNQLATRIQSSGQVFYQDEINLVNFWGADILGLNNPGNPVDPNNFAVTFVGELTIAGSGTANVRVRNTNSDDASRIRIDVDADGLWETGSEDPYGGDQGGNPTSGTIVLPRGTRIPFALQMREGGGGSRLSPEISLDDGATWQRFNLDGMTGATFGTLLTPTLVTEKVGGGTTTLTGNSGSYNGVINVSAGTLVAGSNNALGSTAAPTNLDAGATLRLQNVTAIQEQTIVDDETILTPVAPGVGATSLDIVDSGVRSVNFSSGAGLTGNASIGFNLLGTGLPGADNRFVLLYNAAPAEVVAVDDPLHVFGGRVTFTAGPPVDGTFSLDTASVRTPIYWTGAVDGNWTNGANWEGGAAPSGVNQAAVFRDDKLSGAAVTTVNVAGSVSFGALLLETNASPITFTAGTLITNALEQTGFANNIFTPTAFLNSPTFFGGVEAGVLTLQATSNALLLDGDWRVSSSAQLEIGTSNGTSALGLSAVDVTLDTGVLAFLPGPPTLTNGFRETIWNVARNNTDITTTINNLITQSATLTASDAQGILLGHLNYPDDNSVSVRAAALGAVGFDNNDFGMLWTSDFIPNVGGQWDFRFTNNDDTASIWIDKDQDGSFEVNAGAGATNGDELIAVRTGCCAGANGGWSGAVAGQTYKFAVSMNDTGGGGYLQDVEVQSSATGGFVDLNPSLAALNGVFQISTTAPGALGNSVTVAPNLFPFGIINVSGALPGVSLGALNMPLDGMLLTTSASGTGKIAFATATLNGGNAQFDSSAAELTLNNISQTTASRVTYLGGNFILPEAGVFNYSGTTTITSGAVVFAEGTTNAALADSLDQFGNFTAGILIDSSAELQFSGWFDAGFGDGREVRTPIRLDSGGAFTYTGGGNANVYNTVTLDGDGTIRSRVNELRLRRTVDTGSGSTLTMDTNSVIRIDDQGTIIGTGGITTVGDGYTVLQNANTYTGATTVMNGRLDVVNNNALGAANTTFVQNGGTIRFYNGVTVTENFEIAGQGENGEGALRQENNVTVINGTVRLNASSRIHTNDVSLTVLGEVLGTGDLEKTGTGFLNFENAANTYVGNTSITQGQLTITGQNGLGPGGNLSLSGGGVLGLKNVNGTYNRPAGTTSIATGGFNNVSGNTTINFALNPTGDLILASDAGTFNVNSPITIGNFADVIFRGAGGAINVQDDFGNGAAAMQPANALTHYGFVRNDAMIDMNGNGGIMNGGNPIGNYNLTGVSFLTNGPGNRGLDFNDDNDFTAAVGTPADNYMNLWLGTVHVTAANAGTWTFRDVDRDDWSGIWLDLDRDGIFESNTPGLSSNNGEQLRWNDQGAATVNLTPGDYLIGLFHLEGGGGSRMEYRFTNPQFGAETTIKPADPAQAGIWNAYPVFADNNVLKSGNNIVTLFGNNTYNGTSTITGGALVAAHPNGLGAVSAPVVVDGGTVGLAGGIVVNKDVVTLNGAGGLGLGGAISNFGGDNTFNVTDLRAANAPLNGVVGLGSESGKLTLNAPNGLNLRYSGLSLGGAGELVVNANLSQLSGSTLEPSFNAYLFNNNQTNLPGSPFQLASKIGTGEAFFDEEVNFVNFFGSPIIGLNNGGNPADPNNFGVTAIGDLIIPGSGTINVQFRLRDSDDATRFRIDLNGNGSFEGGAEDPFGGDQGGTPTTGAISLTRGVPYKVALQMREGGGASRLRAELNINGEGWQRFNTAGIDDFATVAQFGTMHTANHVVTKNGAGRVTLTGNNAGLVSPIAINGGVLIADGTTNGTASLGAAGQPITIDGGGALGLANFGNLTSALHNVTLGNGGFVNVAGNNTVSTTVNVLDRHLGTVTLVNEVAATTLTVDSGFDLALSKLSVDGAGDVTVNGVISGDGADAPVNLTHKDIVLGRAGTPVTSQNPLAFWEFNEGGGTTTADSSGNANTGVLNGATFSTGRTGGADRALDVRSGGNVTVASAALGAFNALASTNSATLSMWVYADPAQNPRNNTTFQLQQGGTRVVFVHLPWSDRIIYWDAGQGERVQTPQQTEASFEDGWHHYAFVKTSGFQAIYRDGVLLASGTGTQTFVAPNNLTIAPDFRGEMDDISLYSSALSPTTIQRLFNAGTFLATADNSLVKNGTGKLTLSAANTYVDGTTVAEGTLSVTNTTGSATGTGAVTVEAGGTLAGTGSVSGAVTVLSGGTLEPGLSPGVLSTGSLNLAAGSTFEVEIAGIASFDSVDVTGTVSLGGSTLTILPLTGFTPAIGQTYVIIDNDGSDDVVGQFAQGASVTINGVIFAIAYNGGTGNDVVLTVQQPTTVYVDDAWSALSPGDLIADADPVAALAQPAYFGFNAFTSVNAGITAVTAAGTVIVNSGDYSAEAVNVNKQVTLTLQEAASTFGSLDDSVTTAVILLGVDLSTGGNNGGTQVDSVINGAGALTKTGTGRMTLAGANGYSGATNVNGGQLRATNAAALGTTAGGTTVAAGARLELSGGVTIAGEGLTVNGDGGNGFGAVQSLGGTNTWAGNILLGNATARIGADSGTLNVTGVIDDGPSSFPLIVAANAGTVVLSGTSTYGGDTTVLFGTLQVTGGNDRLPTTSTLHLGNAGNVGSATFDLNGVQQTFAGLISDGTSMGMTVTNGGAANSTLTINQAAGVNTFAGTLTNGGTNSLALTKQGAGTLVLSGASTNTGLTTVSGGTLEVAGSLASAITVGPGTLSGTGSIAGLATINAGGTINPGTTSVSVGALTLGGLTINGGTYAADVNNSTADTLNVSGPVTLTSATFSLNLAGFQNPGDIFTFINNTAVATIGGTFIGINENDTTFVNSSGGPLDAFYSYIGGAGSNDFILSVIGSPTYYGDIGEIDNEFIISEVDLGAGVRQIRVFRDGAQIAALPGTAMAGQTITIEGLTGTDSLLVDYTNAVALRLVNLVFNGGETVGDNDTLSIADAPGDANTIRHTFLTAPNPAWSGIVEIDDDGVGGFERSISYTGLEPVTDNMSAVNRIFVFTDPGAETITLQDNGANLQIQSTAAENTIFAKPTDSLTITLGGGVDTLNLLASTMTGNFTVTGAGNDDLVNVQGNVTLSAGASLPGAASITGVQSINFTGGTLTAVTSATLTAVNAITTSSAAVDVAATTLIASAATGIDLDTTVGNVTATTSAAGAIRIDETDGIVLTNVTAANGSITVTAGGVIVATNVVSTTDNDANDISITAATGAITLGVVNAGTSGDVTISATTGAIVDGGNDTVTDITGDAVSLTAGADIGFTGNLHIDTVANTLTTSSNGSAVAGTHGTWINELDGLTVTSATTTDGVVVITAGGALTANTVTAGGANRNALLTTTAGDITVGLVTATGARINAAGAILDGNGAANNIAATSALLQAANGIGVADAFETSVANLAAANSAGGVIRLANTGAVNVTTVTLFGATVNGVTNANAAVTLTSTGAMTVSQAINAGSAMVALGSGGAILDGNAAANNVTGGSLLATAVGGITLDTAAGQLAASNATSGDVAITNTGAVNITTLSETTVGSVAGVQNPAGAVTVITLSPLTVSSPVSALGAVVLTASDSAAAGDDLTINAPVTSTGGSITLNSGDNTLVTANLSAATTLAINIDSGDLDPNPVTGGATLNIGGAVVITATGATFTGGGQGDSFTFAPQVSTAINVLGLNPTANPNGDTLTIDTTLATNPTLAILAGQGAGIYTFGNRASVQYSSIETATATTPIHISLDATATGIENILLQRSAVPAGTNFEVYEDDVVDTILYAGPIANVLSFLFLGSGNSNTVTIDDVNGLVDLAGTVPAPTGVGNNGNVAGTPEIFLRGNGGTDGIVYANTANNTNQTYGLGTGSGPGSQAGEVLTTNGVNSLSVYFDGMEDVTSNDATPGDAGTLTIVGDANANVMALATSGGGTTMAVTGGYVPFTFAPQSFNAFTVNAGDGNDSIAINSLNPGEAGLAISLNGENNDDTISVGAAPAGSTLLMQGGVGNDAYQLGGAGNLVDNIFIPVTIADPSGTDSLTVNDSSDLTGDTVTITATTIDGINSAPSPNVTFSGVESLDVTTSGGDDVINTTLTGPNNLATVNVRGAGGDDDFFLTVADGLASPTTLNLIGEAGSDDFGSAMNPMRPVIGPATNVFVYGDTTAITTNPGGAVTDRLYLDMATSGGGTTVQPLVIVDTVGGIATATNTRTFRFGGIDDIDLYNGTELTDVQVGDIYMLGSSASEKFVLYRDAGQMMLKYNGTASPMGPFNPSPTGRMVVYGGAGNDYMEFNFSLGNGNGASFNGGADNDTLIGGLGNDTLAGGAGIDTVRGGEGSDRLFGEDAPSTASILPIGQQRATGLVFSASGGGDNLDGGGGNDFVFGGTGDDILNGGLGDDYVHGGDGNDTLNSGGGNDILRGEAGADVINGDGGADILVGGTGDDRLFGRGSRDFMLGGTGADQLQDTEASEDVNISSDTARDPDAGFTQPGSSWWGLNDNDLALQALMFTGANAWLGVMPFATRVGALSGLTSTAGSDGAADIILGNVGGQDLVVSYINDMRLNTAGDMLITA